MSSANTVPKRVRIDCDQKELLSKHLLPQMKISPSSWGSVLRNTAQRGAPTHKGQRVKILKHYSVLTRRSPVNPRAWTPGSGTKRYAERKYRAP